MKTFKGSSHSFAKEVAKELLEEMKDAVDRGAEMYASEIESVAKCCAVKAIELNKLSILEGWGYDEVNPETRKQHDF